MNITVLLALLLLDIHHSERSASRFQNRLIEKLATSGYHSRLHSVRQIYRVALRDDDMINSEELLPAIALQGGRPVSWPIENAMLIVRTSENSYRVVVEKLLTTTVDREKLLLVVILDYQRSANSFEQIVERLGRMLFGRGVLNYCVVGVDSASTDGAGTSAMKYDVVANRILMYDLGTPFEVIFPPSLHSLEGHTVRVLFSDNFPYAYKLPHSWDGTDVFLMSLAKRRFRCKISRMVMDLDSSNALQRMGIIQRLLTNGTIDIHIPRAHYSSKSPAISLAKAYEWESLVLVVPKSDQLNLGNIMLQPFSTAVWSLVGGYLLLKQLFKLLSFLKRRCRNKGRNANTYQWPQPLGSLFIVGVELVSFLLIEGYLAKITEFLLYSRFKQDPQTLEEFYHSNLRVVIPEYMDPLVATFDPAEAAQLRAKMVRPREFAQMPASCCARIHTLQRADYIVRKYKYFDAALGRRLLYVLPGALKTIPMSYLLGRNFAFQNSFEQFILHVYESGMMTQYIDSQQKFVALMERNYISKGWLTLADLLPLFLLVGGGLGLSFVTFGFETLFFRLQKRIHRDNVSIFLN